MRCRVCETVNGDRSRFCSTCGGSLGGVADRQPLAPGTVIGRFRLDRVLGRGGFGITYAGTDLDLNRTRAIKELFPDGCHRDGPMVVGGETFGETRTRFGDEARTLAGLVDQDDHPNLVKVFQLIETNGTSYLVMEYVEGPTAEQALTGSPDGLDEDRVRAILLQIADALAVVHKSGLLHRDVKPGNIVLARPKTGSVHRDRAVLIDFGAAREFHTDKTGNFTQLITPGFAPLEQYGKSARFGPTLDVYALAATGYNLLTGQYPTPAPDRYPTDTIVPLDLLRPNLLPTTTAAINGGLALAASQRPPDMSAFTQLLEGLSDASPTARVGGTKTSGGRTDDLHSSASNGPGTQPRRPSRQVVKTQRDNLARRALLVGLIAALGAAAIVVVALTRSNGSVDAADTSAGGSSGTTIAGSSPLSSTTVPIAASPDASSPTSIAAAVAAPATTDPTRATPTIAPTTAAPATTLAPTTTLATTTTEAPKPLAKLEVVVGSGLQLPSGLAFGSDGALYIADYESSRLERSAGGALSTIGTFSSPSELAIDDTGRLLIVETGKNRIVDRNGVPVAGSGIAGSAGIGGPATSLQLDRPTDVAVHGARVYIADQGNGRVVFIEGGVAKLLAGGLSRPSGLVVAPDGGVFVGERGKHRVLRISMDGVVKAYAGTGIAGNRGDKGAALKARLNTPAGLTVDPAGNLYIADDAAAAIRIVRATTGLITSLAVPGLRLRIPIDVMYHDGYLYVADGARVERVRVDS